ncbi:hypothetical protein LTR97_012775 [Elasticomyces elasticus]|uniref:Pre-mRNA-splicing factor 38B n=1 Tax=Elasticomyces elasticus TaxID=574655 RepID=A0AAN7VXW2_9PEZI|nr:hypothetical protein LTR97_012775 [Elasticomyces elasticus]
MPLGEALNDDYVINLLKSDATRISSARPRAKDAPKPNIRFLRNVIRETDSHNAALKAKEAEDSRLKLLELKRQERSGGSGKRKRDEDGEGRAEKKARSGERNGRWASALGGLGKVRSGERESRSEIKVKGAAESKKRRRDDSRERHVEDERRTKKQQEPGERLPPSERKRSREWRRRDEAISERSRSPQRRKNVDHDRHKSVRDEVDEDSDPLESIIGPRPAPTVRPRGRGAQNAYVSSHNSTIDARFAADYDPSADIHPDHDVDGGEGDDWDMALSALQAKTRFKASQKDRLKAAGFTEEEVGRWEKGGKVEKDVGDVRWKKKGEGREWDAGKAGDEEGRLETKVANYANHVFLPQYHFEAAPPTSPPAIVAVLPQLSAPTTSPTMSALLRTRALHVARTRAPIYTTARFASGINSGSTPNVNAASDDAAGDRKNLKEGAKRDPELYVHIHQYLHHCSTDEMLDPARDYDRSVYVGRLAFLAQPHVVVFREQSGAGGG